MSDPIDLDARRAQYADDTKSVKLGGVVYELPGRLPILVAQACKDGDFMLACRMLFGEEHLEAVGPLLDRDLFIEFLNEMYSDVGESSASSSSSATNGARSRRTSNGSTGSTSRKRASARAT